MLKSLTYSVTFTTTGRTLAETIVFEDGFGAITGPNEAGKSLIIEMIRFALFGTAALRGATSDYKTLKVSFVFAVRGEEYTVERTINSAKLSRGETDIAVGIRPVNNKVVQILGFGLAVFDVSCVANQGDLEALGDMRPADRKRMVDSVIGLGVIEDLGKFAGEEAMALRRRAADLSDTLTAPILPLPPDDYEPAETLAGKVAELTTLKSELDQIKGWLSHKRTEPVSPEIVDYPPDLEQLAEKQRQQHNQRQVLLQTLKTIPEPADFDLEAAERDLASWEAFQAREQFLKLHPLPQFTQKQLDRHADKLDVWDTYLKVKHLRAKIDDLSNHGHHHCPSCHHEWPVEEAEIDRLAAELMDLPAFKSTPDEPTVSRADLEHHQRILDNWEAVADQFVDAPTADKPKLTRADIERARVANEQAARREQILDDIATLDAILQDAPDYEKMSHEAVKQEAAVKAFAEDLEEYNLWLVERNEQETLAAVLEKQLEGLADLQRRHVEAYTYEFQLEQFSKSKAVYDETVEKAKAFETEAEGWEAAKDALATLRLMVKQHLVPSLNRVASHLLKQMTGGQRQVILVDEEFNITVDGQALNTLSGSGKAVANLALRVGLGQVLTNNVLSLFMGDEIDASMDKDRAENTANTLQTLKQRISQILLVTHKYPSADYYIALGNLNDQLSAA